MGIVFNGARKRGLSVRSLYPQDGDQASKKRKAGYFFFTFFNPWSYADTCISLFLFSFVIQFVRCIGLDQLMKSGDRSGSCSSMANLYLARPTSHSRSNMDTSKDLGGKMRQLTGLLLRHAVSRPLSARPPTILTCLDIFLLNSKHQPWITTPPVLDASGKEIAEEKPEKSWALLGKYISQYVVFSDAHHAWLLR